MSRPRQLDEPVRMEMRLSLDLRKKVDAWRGRQADVPGRCEAVRRLLELGLNAQAASDAAA